MVALISAMQLDRQNGDGVCTLGCLDRRLASGTSPVKRSLSVKVIQLEVERILLSFAIISTPSFFQKLRQE